MTALSPLTHHESAAVLLSCLVIGNHPWATFRPLRGSLHPAANFFVTTQVDEPDRHLLTLTDFDFTGVDVTPASNDRVARVVFRTSPTFSGSLRLWVDAAGLIFDTPAGNSTPVDGFADLQNAIGSAPPDQIAPVPEPSGMALFWVAVVFIVWSRVPGIVGFMDID